MGTEEPAGMERRWARRSFERAAASYDAAAVLQPEIGQRMLERLNYIKLAPSRIVDAGCGTGKLTRQLRARYPAAMTVALDWALGMLRQSRRREPWWKRWRPGSGLAHVCADMERLPLQAECADLLWSNLALPWCNDPERVFAEACRVLRPGGLLLFSSFGPDTLRELRAAFAADRRIHVHAFVDMHDLGDMLVKQGFADPVMDMEMITVTYAALPDLLRDLKAAGAHNIAQGRRRGLTGRAVLEAATRAYETFRRDGRLPASCEVIYGHAWKPRLTGVSGKVIPIRAAGAD